MTTPELIRCAERELALRRKVYPKRVTMNMMKQAQADHEIACMEAILELLLKQQQSELLL